MRKVLIIDTSVLCWEGDGLKKLGSEWESVVSQRISLGDTTIKILADYYCDEKGFQVEIMTGDDQLKSYERTPKITQRRRSGSTAPPTRGWGS